LRAATVRTLLVVAVLCVLWGCAGSAPRPQFTDTTVQHKTLDSNDIAVVTVTPAPGVALLDVDVQRIGDLVAQQLPANQARSPEAGDAENFDVNVVITRYAKGNAFARAMLAGLGQIHIDASITVTPSGTDDVLSEFTVKKTFAWGGLYGGTTRIEDVEPAFAEGVAAGVTGQMDISEK